MDDYFFQVIFVKKRLIQKGEAGLISVLVLMRYVLFLVLDISFMDILQVIYFFLMQYM